MASGWCCALTRPMGSASIFRLSAGGTHLATPQDHANVHHRRFVVEFCLVNSYQILLTKRLIHRWTEVTRLALK